MRTAVGMSSGLTVLGSGAGAGGGGSGVGVGAGALPLPAAGALPLPPFGAGVFGAGVLGCASTALPINNEDRTTTVEETRICVLHQRNAGPSKPD